MADVYLKAGAAGSGATPEDPADTLAFISGGLAFNAATDVAIICPEEINHGGSLVFQTYGAPGWASWAKILIAAPGVFPGEAGTALIFRNGTSFAHRTVFPQYSYWGVQDPASELCIIHPGGDGFGFAAFPGPSWLDLPVRCEGAAAASGWRFVHPNGNGSNRSNYGRTRIKKLTVVPRSLNNSTVRPAVIPDGNGNTGVIGDLILSTEGPSLYPKGAIQAGAEQYDSGNTLIIGSVEIVGADHEGNHLIVTGSNVRVDRFNAPLMRPHAPVDAAAVSGFGRYVVGSVNGDARSTAGGPGGYIDDKPPAAPTLQGNDIYGNPRSTLFRPTTLASQIGPGEPMELAEIPEFARHEVAQARTCALELLLAPNLADVDTRTAWIEVEYQADGGGRRVESSQGAAFGVALEDSDAGWTADTYNALTLVKKRITLTTAEAVEPSSLVIVRAFFGKAATVSDDLGIFSARTLVETP